MYNFQTQKIDESTRLDGGVGCTGEVEICPERIAQTLSTDMNCRGKKKRNRNRSFIQPDRLHWPYGETGKKSKLDKMRKKTQNYKM